MVIDLPLFNHQRGAKQLFFIEKTLKTKKKEERKTNKKNLG